MVIFQFAILIYQRVINTTGDAWGQNVDRVGIYWDILDTTKRILLRICQHFSVEKRLFVHGAIEIE